MVESSEDNSTVDELPLAPNQVLDQITLLERQRADLDVAIAELRETHARLASVPAPQAAVA